MNNVASVKDRLKNKSIATGKTVQELLTAYGLERTIFRLSKSRCGSQDGMHLSKRKKPYCR